MSTFEILIEEYEQNHRIRLSGFVNEFSSIDYKEFKRKANVPCFVDFKNVVAVNSQGLAKLIRLLNSLVMSEREVFIDFCPEELIATVIHLPRLKKIKIRSFISTLECLRCYSSDQVAVKIVDGNEKVPERFCSACGEKLHNITSILN